MASKAVKKTVAAKKAAAPAKTQAIDDVKLLVKLMIEHDLGEVSVTDGGRSIALKRNSSYQPAVVAAGLPAAAAPAGSAAPAAGREEEPSEHLVEVKSPMVGTLYAAASPDSDPYVSVGSYVDENTVVCIVEAMKVMNEVRAEVSGIITEICVKNAQPVEYGQVLFRVRPA
jgi:acetyl-CoA carboxylase biotin carboxyl carrier protein